MSTKIITFNFLAYERELLILYSSVSLWSRLRSKVNSSKRVKLRCLWVGKLHRQRGYKHYDKRLQKSNKNILLTQSWTHTALSKGHTTLRGKNATKVNFYCHVGKKILLIYRSRYLKADSHFFLFFFSFSFSFTPFIHYAFTKKQLLSCSTKISIPWTFGGQVLSIALVIVRCMSGLSYLSCFKDFFHSFSSSVSWNDKITYSCMFI